MTLVAIILIIIGILSVAVGYIVQLVQETTVYKSKRR